MYQTMISLCERTALHVKTVHSPAQTVRLVGVISTDTINSEIKRILLSWFKEGAS